MQYEFYGATRCMYLVRNQGGVDYAINRSSASSNGGKNAIMWKKSDGLRDSAFKMPEPDANFIFRLLNYTEGMNYSSDTNGANVYFYPGSTCTAWFVWGSPEL